MFGVQINFKDGTKDWIDPVTDDPVENEHLLTVTNDVTSYEYKLEDIKNWIKYDLCPTCEYDTRDYDCTITECFNPRYA